MEASWLSDLQATLTHEPFEQLQTQLVRGDDSMHPH